jgi:glycosyltransferase involved in cell wall biosynthesis
MTQKIKDNLGIFVITHNRAGLLDQTLSCLLASEFSSCEVVILDNCSDDGTKEVCIKYEKLFPCLTTASAKTNIGASANVLRAFSSTTKPYTWILCDDDLYDFRAINDLALVLEEGSADLIHVGGHPDVVREGAGTYSTPSGLLMNGYQYFKLASFLPANIFRTSLLKIHLKESFDYIYFMYPHMPAIIHTYENDGRIYISNSRLVTATIETQSYSSDNLFLKWCAMALQVPNTQTTKSMLTDQYRSINDKSGIGQLFLSAVRLGNIYIISSLLRLFHYRCIVDSFLLATRKIMIKKDGI